MTSVQQSKVFSFRLNLTDGVGGAPYVPSPSNPSIPDPNYNGSSRLISVRLATAVGTVGTPVASKIRPSGAGNLSNWGIEVFSSSATDDSYYDVLWVNDYIPSQLLDGVQFAP